MQRLRPKATMRALTHLRRGLLGIAFLGLGVRALVPVGFMVAPVSQGWPIQLCPSQSATFFPAASSHPHSAHHSGEPDSESSNEGSGCPLGTSLTIASQLDAPEVSFVLLDAGPRLLPVVAGASVWHSDAAQARGPPAVLRPLLEA